MGLRVRAALYMCLSMLLALPAVAMCAGRIPATVVKVYDGDTILARVEGREEKVRLIGIDCPEDWENEKFIRDMKREKSRTPKEVLALGETARAFTETACPPGSTVQLELDAEERDRYGRLLAYVWVNNPATKTKGGREFVMLNAELVKAGLASLMTIPPDVRYTGMFRKLQSGAKSAKRGIWRD